MHILGGHFVGVRFGKGAVCLILSNATNMCFSCHRHSGLKNKCIRHFLGGSEWLYVLSSDLDPSGASNDKHLQVLNHHNCIRVARDVLVFGCSGHACKPPLRLACGGTCQSQSL